MTTLAANRETAVLAQTLDSASRSDKLEQTLAKGSNGALEQQEVAMAAGDGAELDRIDLNRSATDDEKVSVSEALKQLRSTSEASPVDDIGNESRRISLSDSLPSRTRRSSSGQATTKTSPNKTTPETHGNSPPKQRSVIAASTLAADNKKRPIVLAQTGIRFAPEPELEVADSQSIAKSEALKRIQANLVEWDSLLGQIETSKAKSDQLMTHEVKKREKAIDELKSEIDGLQKEMTKLNDAKEEVANRLEATSMNLAEKEAQNQELDQRLHAYETAYEEMTNAKEQLELELDEVSRSLTEKDNVNRRLNEQNTELQAQLEFEMQRSKTCTIL